MWRKAENCEKKMEKLFSQRPDKSAVFSARRVPICHFEFLEIIASAHHVRRL
jgi:hypothetical protein